MKHYQCLEHQREYYSDNAIALAEGAISRALGQIDSLSQREDACEVVSDLLKQFDAVTNLSAWTEPRTLH